jgi:hypothetical protein
MTKRKETATRKTRAKGAEAPATEGNGTEPKAEAPATKPQGRKAKDGGKAKEPKAKKPKAPKEEGLVVFAFRLKPEERDLIHKAAGPAKASKFIRTLAVAASKGDVKTVTDIVGAVQQ